MHKIHNSGINIFGVIPLCHFSGSHTFLSDCNNSSSTDAIEMKLHMWIELKRAKSPAQDPLLWHHYFWSYSPLSIFWKSPGRWHMCSAEHPILVIRRTPYFRLSIGDIDLLQLGWRHRASHKYFLFRVRGSTPTGSTPGPRRPGVQRLIRWTSAPHWPGSKP